MRVLLVEDDHAVRRALAVALRSQGLIVHDVVDGTAALHAVGSMPYDVILLDLGLPDFDGIHLLPRLRAAHAGPIIVVSARHDQSDKVAALDAGADDYMTKPFGLAEMLARIRAVSRRAAPPEAIETPSFRVNLTRQEVTDRAGTAVALSTTEWAVLEALARAGGAPVTAEALLTAVWGDVGRQRRHYVRVYINTLRKKLEPDPGHPASILSHPGRGYRLAICEDGRAS